jgi:hypothetical protein
MDPKSETFRKRFDHIRQLNAIRGLPDDRKARAFGEHLSLDDDEGATAYTPGSQAFLDYKGQLKALEKQNIERLKLDQHEQQNLIPHGQTCLLLLTARPAQATFRCKSLAGLAESACRSKAPDANGGSHPKGTW